MKTKFLDRYNDKCGRFEISKDSNEQAAITYIDTERFLAQTLYTDKKTFADFPDEIVALYKSTFSDSVVMEKFATGATKTPEEFENLVKTQSLRALCNYPFSAFIVSDKETDEIVGYEVIGNGSKDHAGEAAYLFSKKYHRTDQVKYVGYENVGALILGQGQKLYEAGTKVNKTYDNEEGIFSGGQSFNLITATSRTDNLGSSTLLENLGFLELNVTEKFGHTRYEYELDLTGANEQTVSLQGDQIEMSN